MSKKERDWFRVLERVKKKEITLRQATQIMGGSYRQCLRRYKRYGQEGAKGLVHRGRGQGSNRAKDVEVRKGIIRKPRKFKLEKLKECAQTLFGAEIRSFNTGGDKVEIFGPDGISNHGNNATYTITFDFSQTGAQIANFPPPDPAGWEFGTYDPANHGAYTVFIASDIAAHTGNSDPILVIATQVHELAHALSYIGGVAGDVLPDEAGERMETCVFGGVVQADGYAYY